MSCINTIHFTTIFTHLFNEDFFVTRVNLHTVESQNECQWVGGSYVLSEDTVPTLY